MSLIKISAGLQQIPASGVCWREKLPRVQPLLRSKINVLGKLGSLAEKYSDEALLLIW